jgi:hypothetical protein
MAHPSVAANSKHPLFRSHSAEEITTIVLLGPDGDELSTMPGNRSEQEIKTMAQGLGVTGPVNVLGRMSSGMSVGPVQIMVPSPRPSAASLFGASRLAGGGSLSIGTAGRGNGATNGSSNGSSNGSLVLDSVQRLDRFATDTMATERARVDQEREYWRQLVEQEKEAARDREFAVQDQSQRSLDELRRGYEAKIAAIESSHTRALQDLRALEASKVSHLAEGADEKVQLVRQMSDQTTRILEQSSSQTIAALKAQLDGANSRIRDLESARDREAQAAKDRYDDLRDRMTDEVNRLRDEKSRADQQRLEAMMLSQKTGSDDVRREVDRLTAKYEAELREARQLAENERKRADLMAMQVRDEVTKSEIAILREQTNREPLKTERLIPILNALPADKRAALVSRAIASDFGLEEEEEEKPSLMDSITKTLTMLATSGMANGGAPAKPALPAAAGGNAIAQGPAAAGGGLGDSEEV